MSWGKHKKILAMAKGYRGRANSCYRTAINRLQYQYRDRKQKKRVRPCCWRPPLRLARSPQTLH
jgi:large subunit ribosomal protein L20